MNAAGWLPFAPVLGGAAGGLALIALVWRADHRRWLRAQRSAEAEAEARRRLARRERATRRTLAYWVAQMQEGDAHDGR